MLKNLIFNSLLLVFLASCSLYESGGRQAIEKNENAIVVRHSAGLSPNQQHYYVCSRTKELPGFLREALEVIETPFESRGFSVLLNARANQKWIAVYQHNVELNTHDQCKIYFLRSQHLNKKRVLNAAKIGVDKITEFYRSSPTVVQ